MRTFARWFQNPGGEIDRKSFHSDSVLDTPYTEYSLSLYYGVESRVAAVGPGCLLGSEIPGRAWIKPWRGSRADGILSRVKH